MNAPFMFKASVANEIYNIFFKIRVKLIAIEVFIYHANKKRSAQRCI